MKQIDILSTEDIVKQGTLWNDDIDFGGDFGQVVCWYPRSINEKPVSGILYEKDKMGNLLNYQNYINGIQEGVGVEFYDNGCIKSYMHMKMGRIDGEKYEWYENGSIKCESTHKYGLTLTYKKYNIYGEIVEEKKVLSDREQKMYNTLSGIFKN